MGGTYGNSRHIGDGGAGLDRALPAAKESEEQLRDGAAAVV